MVIGIPKDMHSYIIRTKTSIDLPYEKERERETKRDKKHDMEGYMTWHESGYRQKSASNVGFH